VSREDLRVALLNPCYWPEVRRGSERFARELATGLLAAGQHPRLITSHPGRTTSTVEDGLPITRHWRPPQQRLRRRLYEPWLTHAPLSYRDLVRGDDDIAHALYPTDGAAAARWSARTGRPAVLSYMGIPHRAALANRRLRVRLTLEAVEGAAAVVALSGFARDAFARWLGVEARVIPPGVDLEAFAPDRAAWADYPTIVCAADPREPRKRVGLLVEAFAMVRREHPNARLILSAADGYRAAADGVEVRDLDDAAALAGSYQEAWVAALPSWGEAFGLVLIEALACGTPVVGSNREAIPEVVDRPEIGRLFDGDEPGPLARALLEAIELAQVPSTASACRARAEDFSWAETTRRYLDLYREVLA
jgi:glycosyltransferase involved in cell wall biosynthesis